MATIDDNIAALPRDAVDGATVVDLTAHSHGLRWLWASFFLALVLLALNAAPTIVDMLTSWRDFVRDAYFPDKTELLRLTSMLFVVLPFPLIVLNQKNLQLALSRQLRWGLIGASVACFFYPTLTTVLLSTVAFGDKTFTEFLAWPVGQMTMFISMVTLPLGVIFVITLRRLRRIRRSVLLDGALTAAGLVERVNAQSGTPVQLLPRWALLMVVVSSVAITSAMTEMALLRYEPLEIALLFAFVLLPSILAAQLVIGTTRRIRGAASRLSMTTADGRLVRVVLLGGLFAALWLLIALLPSLTAPAAPDGYRGRSGVRGVLGEVFTTIMETYWPLVVIAALVALIAIGRKFREAVQAASPVTAGGGGAFILLLRSFKEEHAIVSEWLPSLFSTSLEGRLAYHFETFGTLVAIGSPTDQTAYFGARRVFLEDGAWMGYAADMIRRASPIIMVYAPTHWVDWELGKILELDRAGRLIMLFRVGAKGSEGPGGGDFAVFVERMQATPWAAALARHAGNTGVIGVTLQAGGRVTICRSAVANTDAYDCCTLIGHHRVLEGQGVGLGARHAFGKA